MEGFCLALYIQEPYKFGVSGGKVYLEAHTPLGEEDAPAVDHHTEVVNALIRRNDLSADTLDWDVVREVVAAHDGLPVEIASPRDALIQAQSPAL